MKAFVKKLFPNLVAYRNRIVNHVLHYRFKGKPADVVFDQIHKENHWRDSESASGTGSNERSTVEVIRIVNQVLHDFKINTMLDIPCGDFNWMKKVDLKGVDYVGGEIVQSLVDMNNGTFATDRISFKKINLLESLIPKVDLIFTRDCLVHFSYADIDKAISNIKKSGSKYWLTTSFFEHKNYNIITGDWRPVNLEQPPFNLPAPLVSYNENCTEDDRYKDKSLGIWKISDL